MGYTDAEATTHGAGDCEENPSGSPASHHACTGKHGRVRHHYLSLVKRRGKKVAIVAAARVLLELSWTLLRKEGAYRAA